MRVIRTLNQRNCALLRREFEEILMDNRIQYIKFGVWLEEEYVVFFFEQKDGKKYFIRGEAERIIGYTPQVIAWEHAKYLIEHIKEIEPKVSG